LRSDAEQTGRWVGTTVSKEHTGSNSTAPPKHQHPPDSLHGTVTHEAEITIFNSTLKFLNYYNTLLKTGRHSTCAYGHVNVCNERII